jgi:cytochrome o ubiquinol oxidase subunit IV
MAHVAVISSGASKGTYVSYLVGFVLAIALTAVPFWLVLSSTLPATTIVGIVFACAVVQILVHLHYFLHLDLSSEQRWNMAAFVFTVLIIGIMVGGSTWIMFNLRLRTMDQSAMPTVATVHQALDMPRSGGSPLLRTESGTGVTGGVR